MLELSAATREDLLALIAALQAQGAELQAENAQLRAENAHLRARVQALEARLGQNSSNSSRPPSSDPPSAPPRPPQRPSGRARGAQPGHQAHLRPLLPEAEVTTVVDHWPTSCRGCQAPLPSVASGAPLRHQVLEVPPVRAEVIEHRLQRVSCPACGVTTTAALPPEVPPTGFGPRLQAVVALLSGRYRLSRREVAALCDDLLGVTLCVGSVQRLCAESAAALREPVAALEAALRTAPVAHADETSWAEAGQRRWLWLVTTAVATVFTVAASRGSAVIRGLLGEAFGGYLVSDRWSAYTWVPPERRQVCWAHLKRDFQALVDWGGAATPVGEAALALVERLFDAWYAARDDPTQRAALAQTVAPIQAEFRALFEAEQHHRVDKVAGLCRALLKLWPALWTFVTTPGVEPTNNAAERALRPAVLWRKGCFGSQSAEGAEFVARILTVAATCKQQHRNLLDYLTRVCTAAHRAHPIPSLLPAPPSTRAA
jgi:transposase